MGVNRLDDIVNVIAIDVPGLRHEWEQTLERSIGATGPGDNPPERSGRLEP